MATFTYKNWGGHRQTVTGVHRVEFNPTHVVFKDAEGRIIVAERESNVNQLSQAEASSSSSATQRLE